ncbi:reverse transcriptase, partial [Tanacetum coccineum]
MEKRLVTTVGIIITKLVGGVMGECPRLPKFYGDDVKGWVYRCRQFFKINGIDDNDRMELVSMHVYDKALIWHQQFCRRFGENYPWELYEKEGLKRFGTVLDDPLMEFKKLKQEGTIKDYQEKFEELLNMVELDEKHAISLFLGGLKNEINMQIGMFTLDFLTDVFYMAKMQEQTLVALKARYTPLLFNPASKLNTNTSQGVRNVNGNSKPNTSSGGNYPKTNTPQVRKQLSQKEYAEKRAQKLCFYYDQKYVPGHKCAGQLFSLVVLLDEEFEENNEEETKENRVEEDFEVVQPQISLNALTGTNNSQTMRVLGTVGKHVVHILVDCISTHNFLDKNVAHKLGCPIRPIVSLAVTVADGNNLLTTSECKNFKWKFGNNVLTTDVMLLPLGRCDMVLGIQWLATLGDIKCNFKELRMEFKIQGRRVVIRGTHKSTMEWMNDKGTNKNVKLNSILWLCVCFLQMQPLVCNWKVSLM